MNKGYKTGLAYWFVHFLVEIVCFALIASRYPIEYAAITAFLYDALAFAPQAFFGEFIQKFRRFDLASVAAGFMAVSVLIFEIPNLYVHILAVVLLATGNAILHEYGALDTVKVSDGKLAPSAIFVSGGSFGLVIGKFFYDFNLPTYSLLVLVGIIEVMMIILRKRARKEEEITKDYPVFTICRPQIPALVILIAAFVVTLVRGYIGYAIPISWCEKTFDFYVLYFLMGAGKGIGGILSDKLGAGPVGVVSTLLCIPFLVLGKDNMLISVFGIMMFSMTMAITFGMALCSLEENPGLAFGVTTLALFLSTLPPMFYRPSIDTACVLVVVLSVFCSIVLFATLKMKKNTK